MHKDGDISKVFARRAAILGGAKLAVGAVLVGRMYYLQVIEAQRFRTLAEENRISVRLLPPPRGLILDRFGEPLAVNEQNFRVLVVPEETKDRERSLEATLDDIASLIPVSEYDRRRIMHEVERRSSFVPVTVRENLSWDEMARIQVNAPDLPGVVTDEGRSRFYPLRENGAHVLGYVSAVAEEEQTGDPLLQLPGFKIGKDGIERVHDLALRGEGGTSHLVVNALGRVMEESKRIEGKPGADIALTLDLRLQRFAAERFGTESGAIVVMDVNTGEVLVSVSTPGFDPNAFNRGLSQAEWQVLLNNPRAPLINKPIAGQYPPGSTFKTAVALAALESGLVPASKTFHCPGYLQFGDKRFHCWKEQGHGTLDMVGAIKNSCDVYFYETAKRVGIDRIAEAARKLGMGATLGIDLPGEKEGVIPDKEWKRRTMGQGWLQGETLIAGIGQGYVLTTPLQLAVATARIANGGHAVVPHLTRDLVVDKVAHPRPKPTFAPIDFSKANLDVVRRGMEAVINEPGGTAQRSAFDYKGMKMAGKTGTSQVRRITMREREAGLKKNQELEWEARDHALFIGYAPIDSPRYAVTVVVEHGGSGSGAAAPIAKDVLLETLKLNPTGEDA